MNQETKQLFNAPWRIWGDGCQVVDNNGNEVSHTNDDVKTAYRLVRLPELYEALDKAALYCPMWLTQEIVLLLDKVREGK